jgi:hypothetical protein
LTTYRSRSARSTGSEISIPVFSSRTAKTSESLLPHARPLSQPVRRSATGFMNSILPDMSTVMTASPIDASVTCARSFSSKIWASACLRSVMSVSDPAIRSGFPSGPSIARPRVRNHRNAPFSTRTRNSRSKGSPSRKCRRRRSDAERRSCE